MSEILREIDEDLQQDRLKELWKRYGAFAVAGIVVLVLGVSGFTYWRNAEVAAREAAADAFIAAQSLAQETRYTEAANAFTELVQHAPDAYALLARFQRAAVLGRAGDRSGAGAEFQEIASDASVEPMFQELALLMMAMQTADIADAQQLIAQLRPITEDGKPWRFSALEIIAALQLREEDFSGAEQTLTDLSDDLNAPAGMRTRAVELLETLAR